MQNSAEGCSSSNVNKNSGKDSGKSTPVSSPTGSGPDLTDEPRPKFMSDSSESEEDDVSEVSGQIHYTSPQYPSSAISRYDVALPRHVIMLVTID